MPDLESVITGFVQGDDVLIPRTIENVPSGETLTKAWLTIKKDPSDADADALIQKTITAVQTAAGIISNTGAGGTGAVEFILSKNDTALLDSEVFYYFDIQVKTSGGSLETPEAGRIAASSQITRATS